MAPNLVERPVEPIVDKNVFSLMDGIGNEVVGINDQDIEKEHVLVT